MTKRISSLRLWALSVLPRNERIIAKPHFHAWKIWKRALVWRRKLKNEAAVLRVNLAQCWARCCTRVRNSSPSPEYPKSNSRNLFERFSIGLESGQGSHPLNCGHEETGQSNRVVLTRQLSLFLRPP